MKLLRRDKLGRFLATRPVRPVKKLTKKQPAQQPAKPARKLPKRQPAGPARKPPKRQPAGPARRLPKRPPAKPVRKLPKRRPAGPARRLPKRPPAKPARKLPKRQPAKPVRKLPKRQPAKPVRKLPKRQPAGPARKLPKRQPAGPARKPPKRQPAGPARKPPKRLPAKPVRKPPKRRPAGPVRKLPKRRPAGPARKLPKRQPVKKPKKRRRKPRLPPIDERSRDAEIAIQERLVALSQAVNFLQPGLDMAVQSMVNIDKTVDGELRVGNLPAEWRDPAGLTDMIATFSNAFASFRVFDRYPPMGGSFWFSVAVRFGPQNEMEMQDLAKLYKKNKGLFQIGTYPTRADHPAPLQICLTDDRQGLRSMIHNLAEKRGLPPTTILIRLIWGPDWHPDVSGKRPGHYKGEK